MRDHLILQAKYTVYQLIFVIFSFTDTINVGSSIGAVTRAATFIMLFVSISGTEMLLLPCLLCSFNTPMKLTLTFSYALSFACTRSLCLSISLSMSLCALIHQSPSSLSSLVYPPSLFRSAPSSSHVPRPWHPSTHRRSYQFNTPSFTSHLMFPFQKHIILSLSPSTNTFVSSSLSDSTDTLSSPKHW